MARFLGEVRVKHISTDSLNLACLTAGHVVIGFGVVEVLVSRFCLESRATGLWYLIVLAVILPARVNGSLCALVDGISLSSGHHFVAFVALGLHRLWHWQICGSISRALVLLVVSQVPRQLLVLLPANVLLKLLDPHSVRELVEIVGDALEDLVVKPLQLLLPWVGEELTLVVHCQEVRRAFRGSLRCFEILLFVSLNRGIHKAEYLLDRRRLCQLRNVALASLPRLLSCAHVLEQTLDRLVSVEGLLDLVGIPSSPAQALEPD